MFTTLWTMIKEWLQKMIKPKSIEQVLHVTPAISSQMAEAITLWGDMYQDKAPWLHTPDNADPTLIASLGLPAFIASEKSRMAVIEMQSEITVKKTSENKATLENEDKEVQKVESPTIELLNKIYKEKVLDNLRKNLESGIAKGGVVIKPYIVMRNKTDEEGNLLSEKEPVIEVDYIQADAFFPLAYTSDGTITEACFVQSKVEGETIYRRLEYHKLEGTSVTVKNMAFKSTNMSQLNLNTEADLGRQIPLSEVEEWKNIKEEQKIANVDRLLFAYFKMPEANTIDSLSPLGASGFSRAVRLIEQADKQYSRLLWEYEATEVAIDIDRDALVDAKDSKGDFHSIRPMLQQRLFRPIDLGESNTYQPYSPTIRDASILNGLNNILMRIEDVCALSRGTLSDVAGEARTATELKILKQRSYSANQEIQKALEKALKDVVYIFNTYLILYDLSSRDEEYEVSFEWDDSILVDVDAELTKRLTLLQNGLTSKLELRMWYFGETEEQATEALSKIKAESQQAMMENMMMQQQLANEDDEGLIK